MNSNAETATAGTAMKARDPRVRRVSFLASGVALMTPLSSLSIATLIGSVVGTGRPFRRGPRARRAWRTPRMYSTMPTASTIAPPTIKGPAHGVELCTGQVMLSDCGAGADPSVATSRLISAGSCRVAMSTSSCWNSSSQRSEPTGLSAAASALVASSPVVASPVVVSSVVVSSVVAASSVTVSSVTVAATESETI